MSMRCGMAWHGMAWVGMDRASERNGVEFNATVNNIRIDIRVNINRNVYITCPIRLCITVM